MKAIIFHNPRCSTSRTALDLLQEKGCDVEICDYLNNPPTRAALVRLYERAGLAPRDGVRAKEPLAEELGLTGADASPDQILDAMVAHPILIERPIVETPKGVRLCRPIERVQEIL